MTDLQETSDWQFIDDMEFTDPANEYLSIENTISELLNRNERVISLGGDHSITFPVIRAFSKKYNRLNILQLDAHPDLYDELDANPYSHACPFARIMEEKLVTRLVQAGIRTMTGHQHEQAQQFGVEVIEMRELNKIDNLKFSGPVYLSLDMDVLDPAFAPGVSHLEPGGMSTRQLLNIIQNLNGNLVGADIVEYNPQQDLHGVTAMVAAKLLKEIISRML